MAERQQREGEDYSGWYNRVIREGGLIKDSPTKGVWTLMPRTNAIWNGIRKSMTAGMETLGIQEVTMPTLFPMALLEKEAEHVEGFAPEVFSVTKAGSKDLAEPLVVRPTSEVVVSELMRDEIESYRDLPYMINQWTSAFRAEKRPRPFIRTTEFLWQEGHSAHQSAREADQHAHTMALFYKEFLAQHLSLYGLQGEKSENERFPGAIATYAIEGQFGGRALQLATSHNLGSNFAHSHGVRFVDRDSEIKSVFQTSWGSTTRMIGALAMGHGDSEGIIIPPGAGPEDITVIPAWKTDDDKASVEEYIENLSRELGKGAVVAKRSLGERLGAIRYATERTGSPLQLIVGAREIASGTIGYKIRHSGESGVLSVQSLGADTALLLKRISSELYERSKEQQLDAMVDVTKGLGELMDVVNAGNMAVAGWSGNALDEQRLKDETGITIRIHPDGFEDGKDPITGQIGRSAIFAKSY